MPPGPAEPAAARSFATTASTRSGSSPMVSAPSSSTALFRVPVSAPPKYVTPIPTTPSSVSTCSVTIGRVAFGFSAVSASGSSAGSATVWERIPDIFIGAPLQNREEGNSNSLFDPGVFDKRRPFAAGFVQLAWNTACPVGRDRSAEKLRGKQDAGDDHKHSPQSDGQPLLDITKARNHLGPEGADLSPKVLDVLFRGHLFAEDLRQRIGRRLRVLLRKARPIAQRAGELQCVKRHG